MSADEHPLRDLYEALVVALSVAPNDAVAVALADHADAIAVLMGDIPLAEARESARPLVGTLMHFFQHEPPPWLRRDESS